jgi:hypothetical protein
VDVRTGRIRGGRRSQLPCDLTDEERIAVCLAVDDVGQVAGHVAQQPDHERRDAVSGQPAEIDRRHDGPAMKLSPRLDQHLRRRRIERARRGEHQEPELSLDPDEVAEQQEAAAISPLHVVEHEHDRMSL